MKSTYILPFLLSIILLISCGEKEENSKDEGKSKEKSKEVFNPNIIVGTWKSENPDSTFVERWREENGTYKGMGYSISDGKKTDIEFLQLQKVNETWVYSARVTKQNENKEIKFSSVESRSDYIKFSNPMHDDPKSITYDFTAPGKSEVTVEGPDKTTTIKLIKTE